MKKEMFEKLPGSVREAGAILRGEKKASHRTTIGSAGVRAIGERTDLSQRLRGWPPAAERPRC